MKKSAYEGWNIGVVEAVPDEVRPNPKDVEDSCVCSVVEAALGEVKPELEDVEDCCVSEGVKLLCEDPVGVVEGATAPMPVQVT
jgi:hypothetical protein